MNKVAMSVQAVQLQDGVTVCGLFAIAFLVKVLSSGNPKKAKFDQGRMRAHLADCLCSKQLTPFPRWTILFLSAAPNLTILRSR